LFHSGVGTRTRSKRVGLRLKRNSLPYKERVPFVAFFPLTTAGLKIELWKSRKHDHLPSTDPGIVIDIPPGVMLLARGDVVHAGGYMNDQTSGDPRGHLYIYRSGGEVHETEIRNNYNLPMPSKQRLITVYTHAPDDSNRAKRKRDDGSGVPGVAYT
jgi:hypothetical protein